MNIKFSKNWGNKLGNKYFTTIRKHTDEKMMYYIESEGKIFDVLLNGKIHSKAKLISCDWQPLNKLPWGLLYLDTGLQEPKAVRELFEKFGIRIRDECLLLTFEKVEEK